MSTNTKASFEIKTWEESPYAEIEGGGKLTRASVRKFYTGGLEGEGKLEFLMAYSADGTASYVGIELVTGSVGNRPGSFIFQNIGTFDGASAKDTWTVIPGSATGGLRGLRGTVAFSAGHQPNYPIVFEYEFD